MGAAAAEGPKQAWLGGFVHTNGSHHLCRKRCQQWLASASQGDIYKKCAGVCQLKFIGANFKTFQFGRGQGGRKFQPQEYTEYFED
jgi:hypothetical protein